MALMQAFARKVNASLVDPGFIAGVRRKLALDQREAAEIFGGGVNAFSRYETGKARPPFATIADNASAFKRQGDCITIQDIHLYNQRAPCPPLLKSNPR
jgi:transcriptional regulator with XRE-family HTH domain